MISGVLTSIGVFIGVWQLSDTQERHLIKQTSFAKTELIEHQFVKTFPLIMNALERMRNRWVARQGSPYSEWQLDAKDYVDDHIGLRAIEWVNNEYIVKWIVPLSDNKAALNLNLAFEEKRRLALERAKASKEITVTKPIDLVQGGKGLLAYFPIFIEGKFEGFIVGVFSVKSLVDSLLPHAFFQDYNIEISVEEEPMYARADIGSSFNPDVGYRHTFNLYNVTWTFAIWPKKHRAVQDGSYIHYIALIVGVLLSLLTGASLFYLLNWLKAERLLHARSIEYRAALESAIDAVLTIDSNGVIRNANGSVARIFERKLETVIGEHVSLLFSDSFNNAFEKLNRENRITNNKLEGQFFEENITTEGVRAEEKRFPVSVGISHFWVSDELLWCCVARDISERVELETEKETLIAQLKKSNEELDNFAYIASHDLKEPLRAIKNHATFLKEDYAAILGEDGIYKLERLAYLGTRMEYLVRDLLYFSRLSREEQHTVHVGMRMVINRVISRLKEALHEHNAKVFLGDNLPIIIGNHTHIEELFYNLVVNAYKYNRSDRKVVKIYYCKRHSAFCVEDNGIGIEAKYSDEIFRIFKRLNTQQEYAGGTGAGLTFAKKIVENHGGSLWFESELNVGTRFYCTFSQVVFEER
ncbi:hypothetical protein S4054249_07805 [Pseudoalteromonas luteoviolacea]|uniref:histidine kinase n=2 Tax=Pseudoalteromonas luteoviolacea TaxID=43657 RepID=A0A0F6A5U3_9GAMM|nr:hypothetical protein S4054249_07805 [Pseudoalteromonas luteoviolacea]AOT12664.1 hypothetical protein S40542_07805 [Pseudoalteromonas luteoviolacea]AOT17577.1 hypothetical protein S4054_07800 [Pseudoalteromonas luteoviolacea]KKE81582.1 hypothetical protein N479_22050 [Pseudoalteromonas luteoviolacea S4054]KZN78882.1 hypothetical protein N481_00135 [Pseudoalteromonas luteoviolacea S4047-1]